MKCNTEGIKRDRYKENFSQQVVFGIFIQIFLFYFTPKVLFQTSFFKSYKLKRWDLVSEHKIINKVEEGIQKVVFLGASYFGENYCLNEGDVHDSCLLSSMMNRLAKEEGRAFRFYHMAMGGTYAQAQLLWFLQVLKKTKIHTLILDAPRKYEKSMKSLKYHKLHQSVLSELLSYKRKQRNKREKVSVRLERSIYWFEEKIVLDDVKIQNNNGWKTIAKQLKEELRYLILDNKFLVQALISEVRRNNGSSTDFYFNKKLEQHLQDNGNINKDFFNDNEMIKVEDETYFKKDSDFDFVGLIAEICKREGIRFFLWFPPSRKYYNYREGNSNDYDKAVYNPILNLLSIEYPDVQVIDHRNLEFIYPRDNFDGVHATLSMKKTIASEFFSYILQKDN